MQYQVFPRCLTIAERVPYKIARARLEVPPTAALI
jgi:hypothetical protein